MFLLRRDICKPCPFCVGGGNMIVQAVNDSVMCVDCSATGPSAMGIKEYNGKTTPPEIAIEMWNAREQLILPDTQNVTTARSS